MKLDTKLALISVLIRICIYLYWISQEEFYGGEEITDICKGHIQGTGNAGEEHGVEIKQSVFSVLMWWYIMHCLGTPTYIMRIKGITEYLISEHSEWGSGYGGGCRGGLMESFVEIQADWTFPFLRRQVLSIFWNLLNVSLDSVFFFFSLLSSVLRFPQ